MNRLQAEMVLSRQLGVDLEALHYPAGHVRLPEYHVKLRNRQGVKMDDLRAAITLGIRVAGIAALGMEGKSMAHDLSADTVRKAILSEGNPWVSFDNLLDFCWRAGIPVIHATRFPTGGKKMDGMATLIHKRPVIVIGSQRKQPAWHLFILAHELGHIARGHVKQEHSIVVDGSVDADSQVDEEKESDRFAKELLTGRPDVRYEPAGRWLITADGLAQATQSVGKEQSVDPGFIALNYAWHQRFMQVGQAALNILEPNADASAKFRTRYEHLDLSALPEDSVHLFQRLTVND